MGQSWPTRSALSVDSCLGETLSFSVERVCLAGVFGAAAFHIMDKK